MQLSPQEYHMLNGYIIICKGGIPHQIGDIIPPFDDWIAPIEIESTPWEVIAISDEEEYRSQFDDWHYIAPGKQFVRIKAVD